MVVTVTAWYSVGSQLSDSIDHRNQLMVLPFDKQISLLRLLDENMVSNLSTEVTSKNCGAY